MMPPDAEDAAAIAALSVVRTAFDGAHTYAGEDAALYLELEERLREDGGVFHDAEDDALATALSFNYDASCVNCGGPPLGGGLSCAACGKRVCRSAQCCGAALARSPAGVIVAAGPCCDEAVQPEGRSCIGCALVRLGSFFDSARVELTGFEICFACRAREMFLEEKS